jgi:beta-carotene ketolase (CrtO type)
VSREGGGWRIESSASLGSDSVVATRAIVSAVPPQDVVLRLLDADVVPAAVRRRFERVEGVSGDVGQVALSSALRRPPPLDHLRPGFAGSQLWLLAEPSCALENAAAALAGALATRPGVLLTFPSLLDPTAAPEGAATAWINGFVAHRLAAEGGWRQGAEVVSRGVWSTVESCLPGVHELVADSVFTSSEDLTRRTGAVNAGAHVSTIITQLLAGRPARGSADHRSGIAGIYLTGAGTNPGPSISGLPGRACAEVILADLAARGSGRARRPVSTVRREAARWRRLSELALATRRDAGGVGGQPPAG